MYVPYPPLTIDTNQIAEVENYGFAVYNKEGDILPIDKISVYDRNITLKMSAALSAQEEIYVEYAGGNTKGRGNIRDTDEYVAFSEYIDSNTIYTEDGSTAGGYSPESYIESEKKYDENGELLYGKPYPMNNWLNNFKIRIK